MADPISAGILGGASLLGGVSGKKSASSAAKAQSQAYQQALQVQQQQYAQNQANAQPFIQSGTGAVEQLDRLLGLGDSNTGLTDAQAGTHVYSAADQQAGALSALQNSPLFQNEYQIGNNTLLQNLAATGGLRGGNGALAQSNFGAGLFDNIYQNNLSNLASLAGLGSGAVSAAAGAGQSGANSIASLLGQQGSTSAAYTLGQSNITNNGINSLGSILSKLNSGGGLIGSGYVAPSSLSGNWGWSDTPSGAGLSGNWDGW